MNRFKLTIALVSFCCLFLLACATKVSAATNLAVVSSVATQPNLQQTITNTLRTNPNLALSDIRVQVEDGEVDLYGEAQTGFQRALAQKFLENMDGVKIIRNKISVIWYRFAVFVYITYSSAWLVSPTQAALFYA